MLLHDLRQGVRLLFRQPALTTVAVTSLAIGIGANAALVSLTDGLGLRPLAVAGDGRLVRIFTSRPSDIYGDSSFADYRDIAARTDAFDGVAAYGTRAVAVKSADGTADVAMLGVVSGNYFDTLGVRASRGRSIHDADDAEADVPAVMISDRFWARHYQRDPSIVGGEIVLNRRSATIAGVLPAEFSGLEPLLAPDVWMTTGAVPSILGGRAELEARDNRWFRIVAKLRPGRTVAEAAAQVQAVMSSLAGVYPSSNAGRGGLVTLERAYRERLGRAAALIFGAVGFCVLLMACANVAGLLLARAEERRYEMAVRCAIGGVRVALLRQLLVESVVLAAAAAVAGLLLASLLVRALPTLIPPSPLELALSFRIDGRVAAATALLAALTVLGFGLAPAVIGSKADVGALLKTHAHSGGRSLVRRAMLAGQLAVSLALLTTSVLLVRSLRAVEMVDPGFAIRPMLIIGVSPSAAGYSEAAARLYYLSAVNRLGALPGVERVSLVKRPPLSLYGGGATEIVRITGRAAPDDAAGVRIHFNTITPGYFETMGIPLVDGRDFIESDGPAHERVAIVSEAMARRFWPDGRALDRRIEIGARALPCRIVGVARDGKYNSLTETPVPYIYFPLSQRFTGEAALLVRTRGDERALVNTVRGELAALDKGVPMLQVMTLGGQLRSATVVERTTATLVSALGALCVLLSMVGLHALVSYLARRRARETGIRIALGARRADVIRELLAHVTWPIGIGLAGGLALAIGAARIAARSLYGIDAGDPTIYATGAAALTIVAAAAVLLPVRRALHTDPASVLRAE